MTRPARVEFLASAKRISVHHGSKYLESLRLIFCLRFCERTRRIESATEECPVRLVVSPAFSRTRIQKGDDCENRVVFLLCDVRCRFRFPCSIETAFQVAISQFCMGSLRTDDSGCHPDQQSKIEGALRRFESKAKDAIKFSTMNGDLDEALRLKNFLQLVRKVRGTLDIQLIQKKALEAAYRKNLVGTWVTRTGGRNDRRVYKISETGDVTMSVQPDGKTYRGKVVVRGDSVFIDFGDRDNDRVTVIGDRFFLQHWRGDVKGFPDAVQSGYRLKEQKK